MRARVIAGRHEKQELGGKDEDRISSTDYDYLKLDGSKNEDGKDDEIMQNKLPILVANDVNLLARGRRE